MSRPLTLIAATRRLRRAQFAATVRAVQQLDAESLSLLLRHQLPLWIKVCASCRYHCASAAT